MLEKILESKTHSLLNKAMDVGTLRNDVIADNIANVDTPKFKRREVIFEEKMKKALEGTAVQRELNLTNSRHIQIEGNTPDVKPEIRVLEDLTFRNDENNVDIDTEMAKMKKNSINYDAVSRSMSNEIRLLRMAITGRG
ncbi:MAG: flagellar basal body rod protein FlgB [Syntrophomonas sp.]|uniref:flagellar basal body rod protein FlgB n=1 Tax=Syntrophomonas sp. TaxID=2053627 RepID=UPI0026264B57|nr:flagellar basal body rod protein FlgB [Syntrophomonas sp.]MDD2509671.1 flagellar basal body rod protein FlgB [Syntrophomonas sp.]MDD3878506.1 flagellar basal body rod protein FlgB [Syntrophomonas sp.]MDD4625668.1 flagellar basal body rod protein FlgB [Syntrophomonas sp.]